MTSLIYLLPKSYRFNAASFVWLFLSCYSLTAQLHQPARYEIEHKNSFHDFTTVSMGNQGIALLRDKQKLEHGNNLWECILLDTTLNELWVKDVPVEARYRLIGHDYNDQVLYYLFRLGDTDLGKLKIIKIDFKRLQTEEHTYEPELSIRLTHFNVVANQAILAGYVSNEPAVLLYNIDKDQAKIIPGLPFSNSEILEVRANVNQTFNVLLTEKKSKTVKRLISKTFDHAGILLLDDIIEIDADKIILAAYTSTLIRDELMIMGTWSEGVTSQASGIFTVAVDPYSEQKITYYDFAQLVHFLDYLSPKRAAKTKAQSEKKRNQGKIPDFKVHALPARLEETKDGFLFYIEAYYAADNVSSNRWGSNNPFYSNRDPFAYNNPTRSYNSPFNYGPYSSSNTSYNDNKMLQGCLAVFDTQGKLVADHGIKLEQQSVAYAEQISDFMYTSMRSTLLFSKESEINIQVTQADGVSLINEKVNVQPKFPNETIRTDTGNSGEVRFWYGKSFYLFGYQTVKNVEKGNRDVFYINKLTLE